MVLQRDRSSEFYRIFEQLKLQERSSAQHGPPAPLKSFGSSATAPPPAAAKFYEHSQAFAHELSQVSATIGNLTKLVQSQSLFDEQGSEISSLTNIIKQKLAQLHSDLSLLVVLKEEAVMTQKGSRQVDRHSDTVINTLRSRLVHTSQSFKTVLQQRTKKITDDCSRRNTFSADRPVNFESALFQQSGNAGEGLDQAVAHRTTNYYKQRYDAVRQIEAAVHEVSDMFQDFTRLVHEQEELVVRIDSNVDDALRNVESGSSELMKYLASLTSNRGLILKIFFVLFAFLLFFGLFVVR